MTLKQTGIICSLALLCAALMFAVWHEWIIIRLPQRITFTEQTHTVTKKEVTLWCWNHNKMQSEKAELLWSINVADNISQLMSASLLLFEEEKLLDKKTILQSVAITSDGTTALVSFDRAPLKKQTSVYAKWMSIEALLKTLNSNGIKIQGVQFLTNHQPMQDAHLDFSHTWPLSAFNN